MLRDDLENHLLNEAIDTIAVYRREGDHYAAVAVVGNSTYISDRCRTVCRPASPANPSTPRCRTASTPRSTCPVFRNGEEIGMITLQKAFNRNYLETLSLRASIEIAFYAQGLYRYSSLPGIDAAGVLWTRAHPMTGSPFSGSYPFQGKTYKYIGTYLEMGPTAKAFLFVGGPSSNTFALWLQNFLRLSIIPLICVAVATVLFLLWGSQVIAAIRTLLAASITVGRGDYGIRLPAERSDEFGELYRGFIAHGRRAGGERRAAGGEQADAGDKREDGRPGALLRRRRSRDQQPAGNHPQPRAAAALGEAGGKRAARRSWSAWSRRSSA